MNFAHDTVRDALSATALVNSGRPGVEELADLAALERFLAEHPSTGRRDRTATELAEVRALRPRLRAVWEAPTPDEAVEIVNGVLRAADARPWLTDHDGRGWHLHVTEPDASLASRMGAEAAMALADIIRSDGLDRLRSCAAEDCDAVLIDLSRNRSRRFCDTGNCGNRQHVAAYRARQAGRRSTRRTATRH